jgi:hypothetical protein
VIKGDFAINSDIVVRGRGVRSIVSGLLSCGIDVVAFLRFEGSWPRPDKKLAELTRTVKHSLRMKSRPVLQMASLERSKFLE